MVRLVARSPCDGLLPVAAGGVTLREVPVEAITSVMPWKGKAAAVSAALHDAIGAGLPEPGTSAAEGRILWAGRGQALVLGPPVAPPEAAITDQSDAWAVMRLDGAGAADVLARLCPLDLRPAHFATGGTARTLLGQMTMSLTRLGSDEFQILVFRSMAATAVAELSVAMRSVAARD